MGWEGHSTDQLEQRLIECREIQSHVGAEMLGLLEELDRRQVATGDGCRSLSQWVAGRLDVASDTAKDLVRTMRRTERRADLRAALESGASFDRVSALSRIHADVGGLDYLDVDGVRREASRRTRFDASDELAGANSRLLVVEPSLDESWYRIFGGVDGYAGAVIDKALTEKADGYAAMPDGTRPDSSWRRATALFDLCLGDEPPPTQVTVFVDAAVAAQTDGQTGVIVEAGPRVGPRTLEAVLCDAVIEVTARTEAGTPMGYGRTKRTIPPALRRAIIHRDGNRCAGDGCPSRYRLQVHHIVPWSEGGSTDLANLITLCWFHHQMVVHQRGFVIYRHPEHGRVRFREPTSSDPPD
jgi:HNH endonuclease